MQNLLIKRIIRYIFKELKKKGSPIGTRDELRGYDLVLGETAFWRIRPKAKFTDIPPDARPAFCGKEGTPYRAWKEIVGGSWQPSVAFLEGRFWSVSWRGDDAERTEMPAGSWLTEDARGRMKIITEEDFRKIPGAEDAISER